MAINWTVVETKIKDAFKNAEGTDDAPDTIAAAFKIMLQTLVSEMEVDTPETLVSGTLLGYSSFPITGNIPATSSGTVS